MAGFVGPEIPGVTDGLVFYVDAALTYNSGSTIWYDKVGDVECTLTNGPTYSSDGYGSIVFDGTDDYAITPSFSEDSNLGLSVFVWVYLTNFDTWLGDDYAFIINKRDNSNDRQWQLNYKNGKINASIFNGSTSISSGNHNDNFNLNEWCHVGFTTNGVNGSTLSIYHNGVLNSVGTLNNDRGIGSRPIVIGTPGWSASNGLNFYGNMSNIKIYDRALTTSEVLQNYNALKGRFNL